MTDTTAQREAFEAWYTEIRCKGIAKRITREWLLRQDDGCYDAGIQDMWEVWQAALNSVERVEPAGWKLVPVEPTEAMHAIAGIDEGATITDGPAFAADLYRAMLAAAPQFSHKEAP